MLACLACPPSILSLNPRFCDKTSRNDKTHLRRYALLGPRPDELAANAALDAAQA